MSVRRALYVLFGRLLAGPPDAALYRRLRDEGLGHLAAAQGVDLDSDLLDPDDAPACSAELTAEYERLAARVPLRASDYGAGAGDPVAAVHGFLREHGLASETELPVDHLAVLLNVMGELAAQEEKEQAEGTPPQEGARDGDAFVRARAFLDRYLAPWAERALTDLAEASDRRFYRGVAAMASAFLASERRLYAGV